MSKNIDQIYKDFTNSRKLISEEIHKINNKSQVDEAQLNIRSLEDFISRNTYLIPLSDLKYYTDEINLLNEHLTKKRNSFQKIFSFRSKTLRKKPVMRDGLSKSNILVESNNDYQEKEDYKITNTLLCEIENQNRLTYEDIQDEYLDIRSPTQHILLKNIKGSIIQIREGSCSLHVENCSNFVLLVNINGPVMVNHLTSFVINGECHQLRMHDSQKGDILMNVISGELIIERCSSLKFFSDKNIKVNDFTSPNQQIESPNYKKYSLDSYSKRDSLESINKIDSFQKNTIHCILQKLIL